MKQVLIADDNGDILADCLEVVDKDGRFNITTAESPDECLALFRKGSFDAVVLDLSFSPRNKEGLELINHIKALSPKTCIIVLSGLDDQTTMLEAIKLGASRFLSKNLHDVNQLAERINQVLASQESDAAFSEEGKLIARQVGAAFRSKAMVDVFQMVAKARSCPNKTVHIIGETGVGKELIAKAIGNLSTADGPFIAVNCAAIPQELIEGELFGYRRGAFTNATRDYKGKFLEANHGTIFLDEVACLSPAAQQKLLRALQEKKVNPLGCNEEISLNLRVVSATNIELQKLVDEGKFRADLKARLMGIRIEIPPLRKRPEDIDPIINLTIANSKKPKADLDPECRILLRNYDWPENVRQLVTTMDTMIAMSHGSAITLADIPIDLRQKMALSNDEHSSAAIVTIGGATENLVYAMGGRPLEEAREKFTKLYIEKAITDLGNAASKMGLAKKLGVSRNTIKKYLRDLSIDLPGESE